MFQILKNSTPAGIYIQIFTCVLFKSRVDTDHFNLQSTVMKEEMVDTPVAVISRIGSGR